MKIFRADVKQFYKNVIDGFDIVAFDDYLMTQDEEYRKANAGELGEDANVSMQDHILKKYGEKAEKMIRTFV